ncbi:MAG: hypothetical protein C4B59_11865 [Candidatus Methanogaster sp.]|uniref:Uncharacterized protein n=1 Tax=Candidatus Methanogaster sp. TaxID=3386292 RepID=A0AC61L0G4_9EURY|nr:MAG: hypothetical protein C4B59_11865 [ANME-2 cluster archaeon]
MKNETKLKLLKVSCIYGGVFSMVLVGLYVFFVVAFPGTVKFMLIQVILLLIGIASATVFSYMYLNYAREDPEEFPCPILSGIVITAICLISGLIFIIPQLSSVFYGNLESVVYMTIFSTPGYISLILGILSAYMVLSGSRKSPEGIERWKVLGLQLSTVILAAGIVVSGISLSSGILGDAVMQYELTIDTSEETTLFVPLPVDESNNVTMGLIDRLELVEGDAMWAIVDTDHGKALEVRTSTGCALSARQECGKKGWDEGREWVYSHNISMLSGADWAAYEAWVFSSNANTTLYIELSMDTGLGVVLRYGCYGVPLIEGWQTVAVDTSMVEAWVMGG